MMGEKESKVNHKGSGWTTSESSNPSSFSSWERVQERLPSASTSGLGTADMITSKRAITTTTTQKYSYTTNLKRI